PTRARGWSSGCGRRSCWRRRTWGEGPPRPRPAPPPSLVGIVPPLGGEGVPEGSVGGLDGPVGDRAGRLLEGDDRRPDEVAAAAGTEHVALAGVVGHAAHLEQERGNVVLDG